MQNCFSRSLSPWGVKWYTLSSLLLSVIWWQANALLLPILMCVLKCQETYRKKNRCQSRYPIPSFQVILSSSVGSLFLGVSPFCFSTSIFLTQVDSHLINLLSQLLWCISLSLYNFQQLQLSQTRNFQQYQTFNNARGRCKESSLWTTPRNPMWMVVVFLPPSTLIHWRDGGRDEKIFHKFSWVRMERSLDRWPDQHRIRLQVVWTNGSHWFLGISDYCCSGSLIK